MAKFELVLPCYNEARSLEPLLRRVVASAKLRSMTADDFRVILVNNGSTDDSGEVLAALRQGPFAPWLKVVTVDVNRGYGHGLWQGLSAATAPHVGWSHADEQCDPEDAFKAFDLAAAATLAGRPLVARGTRRGRDPRNVFVSVVFALLARLILGFRTSEVNAQPKVFPRDLLRYLTAPPKTFAFDLYFLYCCAKHGVEEAFVPVLFPPRAHGQSRWAHSLLSRWRTIIGMVGFMLTLARHEGRISKPLLPLSFHPLIRSRLFLAGLLVRVVCLPLFGSHYLRDLFTPFVDYAVLHPGTNPWGAFPPEAFPYGSVLFGGLWLSKALGYLVFGAAALGATPLGLALMKLPLLACDIGLLLVLLRVASEHRRSVLVYYWLSPIVVYITYVHGQLDVAATALCTFALLLLIRDRLRTAALALAAATLCKFNVIVAIPLVAAYIFNHDFNAVAFKKISVAGATYAGAVALGLLPVALAHHLGYVTVTSPEAGRVFGLRLMLAPGFELYGGVLLVLVVIGRLCLARQLTRVGLVYAVGVALGTIVATTAAMPGWYLWALPAIAVFYARHHNASRLLYWALNFAHPLYFVAHPWIEAHLGIVIDRAAFTTLQTLLLGVFLAIWHLGLRREIALDARLQPVLVGISGDSGSGKSHLARVFVRMLAPGSAIVVEGDDYHRWERGDPRWQTTTHLNPMANDLKLLDSHLGEIMAGVPVEKSSYDHGSGKFVAPRALRPARFVIVQGLHTLLLRRRRGEFALKVFLQPDETLRFAWKLARDTRNRSASHSAVQSIMRKRANDAAAHIQPQRQHADWVVEARPSVPLGANALPTDEIPVTFRHLLWSDVDLDDLAAALSAAGCPVDLQYLSSETERVALTVGGSPGAAEIRAIALAAFPVRQLLRSGTEGEWLAGQDGIFQLIALCLLRHRAREVVDHHDQAVREPYRRGA